MPPTFHIEPQCIAQDALVSASDYLEQSGAYFGHGTDNAWDESVALLFWAMNLEDDPGESILANRLPAQVTDKFIRAINTRAVEKIPAAYILGEAWFCGLKFFVDERVLVPRSPIAEIIQNEYRPWVLDAPKRILDLCTGSGCIGIAAALQDTDIEVVLADLSADALQVAKKNLDRFNLHERVSICHSDLFESLGNQTFDLILCNPPYVDSRDIASMPDEYRHEPEMGLGSGDDGLDISRRILSQAREFMTPDAVLILELGNSWVHLEQAFPLFPFTWIELANGGQGVCVIRREELDLGGF